MRLFWGLYCCFHSGYPIWCIICKILSSLPKKSLIHFPLFYHFFLFLFLFTSFFQHFSFKLPLCIICLYSVLFFLLLIFYPRMLSVFLNLLSPFKQSLTIILLSSPRSISSFSFSFCLLRLSVSCSRWNQCLCWWIITEISHYCQVFWLTMAASVWSVRMKENIVNCSGESGEFSHELVTNDESVVIK